MKNSVVLLLMILLPLQTAWGVAALFCQHESSSAQWHWGHHEHQADAACQSAAQHNHAADTASVQHDSNSKKTDQSHAFQIANHSDHLQANPLGLNPPQLQMLIPATNDFLMEKLDTSHLLLYQTPYLKKPKPPLWPA